jgi:hypothetical protein
MQYSSIKFPDLLTGISVLVAFSGFLYTWIKDRNLKRREYADRIRRAAAETVVALGRWRELALRLYDDIQPLVTETDVKAVKNQTEDPYLTDVRDFFWHGLMAARAISSKRILDEKTESAYLNLYGYEPHVQSFYDSATNSLAAAEEILFWEMLQDTQTCVLALGKAAEPRTSAKLGNQLRTIIYEHRDGLGAVTARTVETFRKEMLRLITSSDSDIVNKAVHITTSIDLQDVGQIAKQDLEVAP